MFHISVRSFQFTLNPENLTPSRFDTEMRGSVKSTFERKFSRMLSVPTSKTYLSDIKISTSKRHVHASCLQQLALVSPTSKLTRDGQFLTGRRSSSSVCLVHWTYGSGGSLKRHSHNCYASMAWLACPREEDSGALCENVNHKNSYPLSSTSEADLVGGWEHASKKFRVPKKW